MFIVDISRVGLKKEWPDKYSCAGMGDEWRLGALQRVRSSAIKHLFWGDKDYKSLDGPNAE